MRRFFFKFVAATMIAGITPAIAEPAAVTVGQALALITALKNLDGHMIVVKQNGADNIVMTPWEFNNGKLRLRIKSDINILEGALKIAENARQDILKEALKKAGNATELKPGTPEYDDYQKQYADMVAQPVPGAHDLSRIKASELNLDRNEIPGTVLSALSPILDDDVPLK